MDGLRRYLESAVDEDTGEEGAERDFGFRTAEGVEHVGVGVLNLGEGLHEGELAAVDRGDLAQREEHDHEAADEEADAVDGVKHGAGAETAEQRVGATHEADQPDRDPEDRRVAEAGEERVEVEDLLQGDRARVQDQREQQQQLQEQLQIRRIFLP